MTFRDSKQAFNEAIAWAVSVMTRQALSMLGAICIWGLRAAFASLSTLTLASILPNAGSVPISRGREPRGMGTVDQP